MYFSKLLTCFVLPGAINEANGKPNTVQNQFTGEWAGVPAIAAQYRETGQPWVVIGDEVRSSRSLIHRFDP